MNAASRSSASEAANHADIGLERPGALHTDDVVIPPSAFIMGTDIEPFYGTILPQSEYANYNEAPMHVVYLGAYRIDRYPVTNAEYAKFVNATRHPAPRDWKNGKVVRGQENLPVVHVNWNDANAYAEWAGGRLPSEAEWEKAARGADGRIYPWGDDFLNQPSADCADGGMKGRIGVGNTTAQPSDLTQILTDEPTPVGARPLAASPYGVHEVAGNVWEWTSDRFRPYSQSHYIDRSYGEEHKVLRGGSWLEVRDETAQRYFRSANRFHAPPDYPKLPTRKHWVSDASETFQSTRRRSRHTTAANRCRTADELCETRAAKKTCAPYSEGRDVNVSKISSFPWRLSAAVGMEFNPLGSRYWG